MYIIINRINKIDKNYGRKFRNPKTKKPPMNYSIRRNRVVEKAKKKKNLS